MDCFLEPTKQNVLKEAAKRESAAGYPDDDCGVERMTPRPKGQKSALAVPKSDPDGFAEIRDFALDLLFFHRGLNCLVAF
jgi:hypothetical protein